jgi:hypothetical protein
MEAAMRSASVKMAGALNDPCSAAVPSTGRAATDDAEEPGGTSGAPTDAGEAETMGGGTLGIEIAVVTVPTGRVVDVDSEEGHAIMAEERTTRRATAAAEDDGGDELGQDRSL